MTTVFSMCALVQTAGSVGRILLNTRELKDARSIVAIHCWEIVMNKDQVKGRIKEAEGKAKEVAGKIVGNKRVEEKGKVEQTVGKVQAGYGDLKDDLKKHP